MTRERDGYDDDDDDDDDDDNNTTIKNYEREREEE